MESYKSDVKTINCDIETVFAKLSNPETFKTQIEKFGSQLPPEVQENLNKVQFMPNAIVIESPMGALNLEIAQKQEPSLIKFNATGIPVKLGLDIELAKVDDEHTTVQTNLQVDLPMMLRGMVGPQLKQGAKKMADMLAMLPYKSL